MRSNHSLSGSAQRRTPAVSGMPLEWLDAGSWRLPSGKALAEYALQAGFLVPMLLRSEEMANAEGSEENFALLDNGARQTRATSKGSSR